MRNHRLKIGKAAVNAVYKTEAYRAYQRQYQRNARATDPNRYFHDTYQSSLIGRLRGTRPSTRWQPKIKCTRCRISVSRA